MKLTEKRREKLVFLGSKIEFYQRMKKTLFNNLRPKSFTGNNCSKIVITTTKKDDGFMFLK